MRLDGSFHSHRRRQFERETAPTFPNRSPPPQTDVNTPTPPQRNTTRTEHSSPSIPYPHNPRFHAFSRFQPVRTHTPTHLSVCPAPYAPKRGAASHRKSRGRSLLRDLRGKSADDHECAAHSRIPAGRDRRRSVVRSLLRDLRTVSRTSRSGVGTSPRFFHLTADRCSRSRWPLEWLSLRTLLRVGVGAVRRRQRPRWTMR